MLKTAYAQLPLLLIINIHYVLLFILVKMLREFAPRGLSKLLPTAPPHGSSPDGGMGLTGPVHVMALGVLFPAVLAHEFVLILP